MNRRARHQLAWGLLACGFGFTCFLMGCEKQATLKSDMALRNAELARREILLAERLSQYDFGAVLEACQFAASALKEGGGLVLGEEGGAEGGVDNRLDQAQSLARFREGGDEWVRIVTEASADEKEARTAVVAALERLRKMRLRFAEEVEPDLPKWRREVQKTVGQLAEWRAQRIEKKENGEYVTFPAFLDVAESHCQELEEWAEHAHVLYETAIVVLRPSAFDAYQAIKTQREVAHEAQERAKMGIAAIQAIRVSQARVDAVRKELSDLLGQFTTELNTAPQPGWTRSEQKVRELRSRIAALQKHMKTLTTEAFMEESSRLEKAVNKLKADLEVLAVWTPGSRHPSKPHVFAIDEVNTWDADPGYWFVNPGVGSDLVVRWEPGRRHPDHPHVSAGQTEGTWAPDPGYRARKKGDLDPVWTPGLRHPTLPHIFAAVEDGKNVWDADPGYWFVNPGANSDLVVRWVPGRRHPDYPHISAGQTEGTWVPDEGYRFRSLADDGDFSVTWIGR